MAFENKQGLQMGWLETIVNVQWPGGFIVLEVFYTKTGLHPTFSLQGIPFAEINIFDAVLKYPVPNSPPASVADPVTKAMIAGLRLWNRPPIYKPDGGPDHIFTGRTVIFMQGSKVRSTYPKPTNPDQKRNIVFTVRTPAAGGSYTIPGAFGYWVWSDFGDPFPGIEPNTYQGNIAFDSVWGTQAEADARAALLNEHSAYHVEAANGPDTNVPDLLEWIVGVSMWKGKMRDFPLKTAPPEDVQKPNDWNQDFLIDSRGDSDQNHIIGAGNASALAAANLTFTLDAKLNIINYERT